MRTDLGEHVTGRHEGAHDHRQQRQRRQRLAESWPVMQSPQHTPTLARRVGLGAAARRRAVGAFQALASKTMLNGPSVALLTFENPPDRMTSESFASPA